MALAIGRLFIICTNWFNLYPAKIFRSSIDIVIETLNTYNLLEDSDFQKQVYEDLVKSLVFLGIALFALALIKGVFTFFMRYTIIMVSRFIEFDLKNDIYNHYQQLDTSFYKENKTGDIMNRIGDDVSKVRMYLGPSIMYLINLIVLFTLVITTMVSINAELSVYILLPLPIMSIAIYYVSRLINIKSERSKTVIQNFQFKSRNILGIE